MTNHSTNQRMGVETVSGKPVCQESNVLSKPARKSAVDIDLEALR